MLHFTLPAFHIIIKTKVYSSLFDIAVDFKVFLKIAMFWFDLLCFMIAGIPLDYWEVEVGHLICWWCLFSKIQ